MIQVRELHGEHNNIPIEHPTLTKLSGQGYAPDIENIYTAYDSTSDTSTGYIVTEITRWPDSLNNIDVAATDRVTEYICGCDGFFYHYAKDSIEPSGECKHVAQVRQYNRKDATTEENQATL